jgi:predicted DNA-binding WGR domain protein
MILTTMLGRYEYKDGKSAKFWEIELMAGGNYRATYGRIGSAGQSTDYDEITAIKKIREKISKGYLKVSDEKAERLAAIKRLEEKKEELDSNYESDFMRELRALK